MKQFRHLEKINKELEQENEHLKQTIRNRDDTLTRYRETLNTKNVIIENCLRSIELLKTQIEGKS